MNSPFKQNAELTQRSLCINNYSEACCSSKIKSNIKCELFSIFSIVMIISALFTDFKTFSIAGVDYSSSSEGKLCHLFPLFKYIVFLFLFLYFFVGLDFVGHFSVDVVHRDGELIKRVGG